ncbi:ABC transporter permease subunit [Rhodococcus cerastii]|uniref:ABC transporter permease subunit n=1 Tax=Rhodococcus cerastii TaxID=908616 RepID=A0ABU4CZA0_9NOCA|nr:ABC transporter permease [Rhodococcus cerastii]MDV6302782.1 ABC transporter permease subunit [Rhodococcus cerastii]
MARLLVVLKKELRQQLQDRRTLTMMLVPALVGPLICLVLLLAYGSNSELDRKELTVSSSKAGIDRSELLKDISGKFDGQNFTNSDQRAWNVKWSESPWDDLVRGESDLALVQGADESWQVVPSPISLDSALLTAESIARLNTPDLTGGALRDMDLLSSPTPTSQNFLVIDFFAATAANSAIASYLLPILLISLFTMAGSPIAIECIAAEKEHGTFDSLRVLGAPGLSVMTGKLLSVALATGVVGSFASILLIAVGNIRPRGTWNLGMDYVVESGISGRSILTISALTLSALILCSAILLFVSGIAQTVKEAQYWVSIASLIPISLGGASVLSSSDRITRVLEMVPFSNVAIGISNTVAGTSDGWSIAACLAVNGLVTVSLIGISVRMLFGEGDLRFRIPSVS